MSITTTTNRIQYTGNGVNTTFAFPYKFFEDTDLEVYVDDVLKTITTHYAVSTIGDNFETGGNVVFLSAPPNLSIVTIVRNLAATQATDYQDYATFPANVFESDLDRRAMLEQQILDLLGRQLAIPVSDPLGLDTTLPALADRISTFLAFDAAGEPIAAAGVTSVPISTWAATLLDDATAAAGRATLDVYSKAESGTVQKTLTIDETVASGDIILQKTSTRKKQRVPTSYVNGSAISNGSSVCWLTSTLVIHAYGQGPTVNMRAGTVNDDLTITWGTAVSKTYTLSTPGMCVKRMSDTSFVLVFGTGADGRVLVGTVSGTAITLDTTPSAISAAFADSIRVDRLSDTSFICVYKNSANNPSCRVGTVSGVVITLGAETVPGTPPTLGMIDVVATEATQVAVVYMKTDNIVYIRDVTISGTVATWNTESAAGLLNDGLNTGLLRAFMIDSLNIGWIYQRATSASIKQGLVMGITYRVDAAAAWAGSTQHWRFEIAGIVPYAAGYTHAFDVAWENGVLAIYIVDQQAATHHLILMKIGDEGFQNHPVPPVFIVHETLGGGWGDVALALSDYRLARIYHNTSQYPGIEILQIPNVIGVANGAGASVPVSLKGYINGLSGMTPGRKYYAHPRGGLTPIPYWEEAYVGQAISATEIVR